MDLQVFIIVMNKFGFGSQALLLNESKKHVLIFDNYNTIVLKTSYIKFSEKMIRDAKENFIKKLEVDNNKPLVARNVSELSNLPNRFFFF